jgi:hypothetical protein
VKVVADRPMKLAPGGTAQCRVQMHRWAPTGKYRLELSDPPEGVAIQKVDPTRGSIAIVLSVDADKATPGLKGNLLINTFLMRKPPAKEGQPPPKVRRIPLGPLPAVPFEIVGG